MRNDPLVWWELVCSVERQRVVMVLVRPLLLIAGLGMVVAACGVPAPTGNGAVPPAPTTSVPVGPMGVSPKDGPAPDLAAACGPVPLDWPIGDLDAAFVPLERDIEELVDDAARVEFDLSGSTRWSVVKETSTELLVFGQPDSSTTGEPLYRYAQFELVDDDWRAGGWGGCRIEVTAEGFGIATFELNPDNPPDASETTLHVLATERSCASGQVPSGREVVPVVIETSDAVEIIVLVESPVGLQICPSNPVFPLTVELDGPLGDRMIRDAALYPIEDRPWPPPPANPVLSVYTAGDAPIRGTANVVAWDGDSSGALLFEAEGWASEPIWFQSFEGDYYPTAITGFVTECDSETGCVEECEGAACDALPRLGAECSMSYTPTPGEEATMTVIFTGTTCTIETTDTDG